MKWLEQMVSAPLLHEAVPVSLKARCRNLQAACLVQFQPSIRREHRSNPQQQHILRNLGLPY